LLAEPSATRPYDPIPRPALPCISCFSLADFVTGLQLWVLADCIKTIELD